MGWSQQRFLGALLALVGVVLGAGGAWLTMLGGSPYYLIAGATCLGSGILIWRRRIAGFLVYSALVVGTVIWALWEVGPNFWLLLPRIGGPLIILGGMFISWALHRSRFTSVLQSLPRLWRTGAMCGVIIALAACAMLTFYLVRGGNPDIPVRPAQPVSDWSSYAGDKGGARYSSATQITPANVAGLKVAWSYRTGDLPQNYPASRAPQMFEATPLQIGETLYVCTPRNIVIALDADTGKPRWRFDPHVDDTGVYTLACRGLAYHQAAAGIGGECRRRLLVATVDGRMIAISAKSGQPCAKFGRNGMISLRSRMGDVKPGFQFNTSPPAIIGNVAVVGGFVLDNMGTNAPSGVVRGFDVATGRLLWSWDAGNPEPNALPPPDGSFVRSSPNVWSLISADEKLGLVYLPTGNPSPDYFGGQRNAAMDRFGSSVVALDAMTGKLRWSFQTVHHDLWDYDVAPQPLLVDLPIRGQTVPALIQGTKQGELFVLDRRNGKPLLPIEERFVPQGDVPGERYSTTQPVSIGLPSLNPPRLREADMWGATPIDQMWCRIAFRRLHYEGRFTPPSLRGTLQYPGNSGIMNWGSLAVDLTRNILIVPTSYMPMVVKLIQRKDAPATQGITIEGRGAISPMLGTPYAVFTERPFASPIGLPCNAPPWGQLTAIDLQTHKILWRRPLGTTADHAPFGIAVPGVFNQGGAIVTRSGVAFIGATLDNYLRAFDVTNGRLLWRGRLPAGGQALPMTYVSPRTRRQYVVIAAGGHQFMNTKIGDYIVAFALPGAAEKTQ